MPRSALLQQLVNTFPPESKIRESEVSVGQQVLNPIANQLEKLEKELVRQGKNVYIASANLDEVDLLYKVELGPDFEFDQTALDPLKIQYDPPTITGTIGANTYSLVAPTENTLKSFWYETLPSRFSIERTVGSVDHELLSFTSSSPVQTTELNHHLGAGYIYVETVGGTEYVRKDGNTLRRAHVVVEGTTRKGTKEQERLFFPWDLKHKSNKEWRTIEKITAIDFEDGVDIIVTSGDFSSGPYMSFYNLEYGKSGKKVDVFWDISTDGEYLEKVRYNTDEWQQLIIGMSDKSVYRKWELLDSSEEKIIAVDLAIQPFTDRAFVIDDTGILRIYDLAEEFAPSVNLLKGATDSDIIFETNEHHLVLGEDIAFTPWHQRIDQEIISYRIWYQEPTGTQYGLLNGSAVSYSTNFWNTRSRNTPVARNLESEITIEATERGEYLVCIEAVLADGTTSIHKDLFFVLSKTPLVEFDVGTEIGEIPVGIEFDSDQKLFLKEAANYHQINLHYDTMLIDYEGKVVYMREPYDSIEVTTNA